MHKDLLYLNEVGFTIVAMTIIGLPYDTEKSIMEMADWITTVSKYQTANLLTPLPATSNWEGLVPLDADGGVLADGEMRPYHLYTGRQFVHQDERWSMKESRELFDRYHSQLNPVDNLYERLFRLVENNRARRASAGRELHGTISARINEFSEALRTLSDSSKEVPEAVSARLHEVSETLARYRIQLAATGRELPEVIAARIGEATEVLGRYRAQISNTGREISDTLSTRINEVNEALMSLSTLSAKPVRSGD
jgi:radical SAM superfamily enzyme YgiQ (UPF0313 family)